MDKIDNTIMKQKNIDGFRMYMIKKMILLKDVEVIEKKFKRFQSDRNRALYVKLVVHTPAGYWEQQDLLGGAKHFLKYFGMEEYVSTLHVVDKNGWYGDFFRSLNNWEYPDINRLPFGDPF